MTAGPARPIKTSVAYSPDFHRTYTSTYEVITDSVTDGAITAIEAVGIPAYRSLYSWYAEVDPWAFCDTISADIRSVEDTRKLWVVTVTHSTRPATRCGDTRIENPLDEPPIISGSFAQFSRPAIWDIDGEPICNSVDEPFVPAPEMDDSRDTLIVEVNTEDIDLVLRARFKDAINDAVHWGLAQYTIKLQQWAWQIAYHGTCGAYIRNRFEFGISYAEDNEGNVIGWLFSLLDAGFRHKADCGAAEEEDKYLTNRDAHDNQIHQPRPLDGAGGLVSIACGDDPTFLKFHVYKEKDFSELPIPNPLPGPFA